MWNLIQTSLFKNQCIPQSEFRIRFLCSILGDSLRIPSLGIIVLPDHTANRYDLSLGSPFFQRFVGKSSRQGILCGSYSEIDIHFAISIDDAFQSLIHFFGGKFQPRAGGQQLGLATIAVGSFHPCEARSGGAVSDDTSQQADTHSSSHF